MEMLTDTLQGLERTTDETIDVTSRTWRSTFAAQLTQDLTDDVHAYAVARARWIQRKTDVDDPGLADELTQDAFGDTFAGVVIWDPATAPLALHLKRVIKGRTARMMERDERFPGVRITGSSVRLEQEISEALERERENSEADLGAFVDRTIAELRTLAHEDDDVLVLLGAYAHGAIDRREVMRVSGMTSTKYHNAVRRMLRLVERLPAHIRHTAIDAME